MTSDQEPPRQSPSLVSEVRELKAAVRTLEDRLQALRSQEDPGDPDGPQSGNSVTTVCSVLTQLQSAPEEIARELGLDKGTTVIRKRETLYRGGTPVFVSTAWMDGRGIAPPPSKFQETNWMIHGPGGHSPEGITGRLVAEEIYEDSARGATGQDADWLGVPIGSTVSVGRIRRQDWKKTPLEYIEWVAAPGVWSSHRPTRRLVAD